MYKVGDTTYPFQPHNARYLALECRDLSTFKSNEKAALRADGRRSSDLIDFHGLEVSCRPFSVTQYSVKNSESCLDGFIHYRLGRNQACMGIMFRLELERTFILLILVLGTNRLFTAFETN